MIKIGNIKIDIGREPLIIPEMGINHSGKIDIAFKIIDAAKKAGAKIIKNGSISRKLIRLKNC